MREPPPRLLERYLLFWLALLSTIALFWHDPGPTAFDPFVGSRPALSYLIAATMFAVGCLLPRDEVRQIGRRWPSVVAGTAIQYTAMPLLAFGLGRLFPLSSDALIGLIMVGCVPGAMASNVLTLLARGNVTYSVSLTTSATLLSPLVVPIALKWTLRAHVDIDALAVCVSLLEQVVAPVVAGYVVCRLSRRFAKLMQTWGPVVAHLAILWIIAVVVALNRDRLKGALGFGDYAAPGEATVIGALALLNLLGYGAGYLGGLALRLPERMRRALTLEVGMQNAGLGTVLALQFFPEQPGAAIPPALYTFGCMMTGTALAGIWARFGREADEPTDGRVAGSKHSVAP